MLNMGVHDGHDEIAWLTYLRIAPDQYIEMFNSAINPPEFIPMPIPKKDDSPLNYIALGTEDIDETLKMLKNAGISVLEGEFSDPSGIRYKIVSAEPPVKPSSPRMFTSLAGLSLYTNSFSEVKAHFIKMGTKIIEENDLSIKLQIGCENQWLEFVKTDKKVRVSENDLLAHFAFHIHSVPEAVKAWGANGVRCCFQPFTPNNLVPVSDDAKGNMGLDRCEIIWNIAPDGNKVEIMVEPGNTLQQEWEEKNPY